MIEILNGKTRPLWEKRHTREMKKTLTKKDGGERQRKKGGVSCLFLRRIVTEGREKHTASTKAKFEKG